MLDQGAAPQRGASPHHPGQGFGGHPPDCGVVVGRWLRRRGRVFPEVVPRREPPVLERARNTGQSVPESRCPYRTDDRQGPARGDQRDQPPQARPEVGDVVQHGRRSHHVETAAEIMGQKISEHPIGVSTAPTRLVQNPLIDVDSHNPGYDPLQLPGQQPITTANAEGDLGSFGYLPEDRTVVVDVAVPAA